MIIFVEFNVPFIGLVVVGVVDVVVVVVVLGFGVDVTVAAVTGDKLLVIDGILFDVVSADFVVIGEGIIVVDSTLTVEVAVVSGPFGGLIDGNVDRKVVSAFGG